MRVIAGKTRGLRLSAPAGMNTRPTADRVREALFSIMLSRVGAIRGQVLDLCAGTGALGIEALSRGAESCCFVENNRTALTFLRRNLAAARFEGQATVLEMDALKAVRHLVDRRFSFVFFDPPYASPLYLPVAQALSDLQLVEEDGLLVMESASKNRLDEQFGRLLLVDRRIYGDTALHLYSPEVNE